MSLSDRWQFFFILLKFVWQYLKTEEFMFARGKQNNQKKKHDGYYDDDVRANNNVNFIDEFQKVHAIRIILALIE